MTNRDGGSVYPTNTTNVDKPGACHADPGMTVRQRYKMAALQGILANVYNSDADPRYVAHDAAAYADAMIAEDEAHERSEAGDDERT